MKFLFSFAFVFYSLLSAAQSSYRNDFDYLWSAIKEDYAYWDRKNTNWEGVKVLYAPLFDTITERGSFVLLLEKVFNELYDHHASLNTNTKASQRLVPSGTDIWAEYLDNNPVITEVRPGFGASNSGMKAGMEIISINDLPVEVAILQYLPRSLQKEDKAARDYALRVSLAGLFIDDRKIVVKDGKEIKTFYPDRPVPLLRTFEYVGKIESKILPGNLGYIRINNMLWDNNLIPLFDSVLNSLAHTAGLILDLRETPSGGNTTVARAIIGSFITKESFYQKHELTAEQRNFGVKRSWMEIVSPRQNVYTKPLAVLVNHWTGSVGEGITIAFDALDRATIIGTPMAGLNGAIYSYTLPETRIGFAFPVEKLYHVNGSPREDFIPGCPVDLSEQKKDEDLILSTAINCLTRR